MSSSGASPRIPLVKVVDVEYSGSESCCGGVGGETYGLSGSSSGVSSVSGDGLISTNFNCEKFETHFFDSSDYSERGKGDKRSNSEGVIIDGDSDVNNRIVRTNRSCDLRFLKGTGYKSGGHGGVSGLASFDEVDSCNASSVTDGSNASNNYYKFPTLTVPGEAGITSNNNTSNGGGNLPTRRPTHQKVTRSAPLLAPPPRFSPDDEEDDHAWVDLADTTCYFECPELLESYRALRPRLSYRLVCGMCCVVWGMWCAVRCGECAVWCGECAVWCGLVYVWFWMCSVVWDVL